MSPIITSIKTTVAIAIIMGLICCSASDAKLLRRSRLYEDSLGGYDGPYNGGATGERAIVTVRGARNPYDGSAPSRIAIEDNPYRGPYPRGVYDRLDSGYSRRASGSPYYPQRDYGYNNYNGYNSG